MDALQYVMAARETAIVVWLIGFVCAVGVGGVIALVATRG